MKQAFAAFLALFTFAALADGVPLRNGRYPGATLVFDLSKDQKERIERFRTCHVANAATMNWYTPYVFELNSEQAKAVKTVVGFVPARFLVYETYLGYNDAGPHWNLALRFAEDKIEVPIKFLLAENEANRAQQDQGWKPENPCFPTFSAR